MSKKTLYKGNYLTFSQTGTWEFAERANANGCVGVLAINECNEVILVEQYRIPVGCRTIELTAGLVGDEEAFIDESIAECANRELVEETGYKANNIHFLLTSPSSAGLCSEVVHLFLATQLEKVGYGGGVDNEDITIHHVPLDQLEKWHLDQINQGKMVDAKIFATIQMAKSKGLL